MTRTTLGNAESPLVCRVLTGENPGRRVRRSLAFAWAQVIGTCALLLLTLPRASAAIEDYYVKRSFEHTTAAAEVGAAVATAGAYIAAGAPGESTVYVYDRLDLNTPPVPVHTIVSPNASAGDGFGSTVVWNGPFQLLIGAPGEDTMEAGVDSGAVYLYDVSGTPTLLERFTIPMVSPGAGLGNAITIGAGFAIGARGDDGEATNSGAVYVFNKNAPYAFQYRIPNPTPAANDHFGTSLVAYSTGLFMDFYVVSAPNDSGGVGALYKYAPGSSTPLKTITHPTGSVTFGYSLAPASVAGRLLVGAPGVSGGGAAYLMDPNAPTAILKTFTRPGGGVAGDDFGFAVTSANGNYVISAPGAAGAGAVYLFGNTSPSYPLRETLSDPTPDLDDNFGWSVGGGKRVVVGALQDDDGGATDAGAVHLFEPVLPTGCWTTGEASQIGEFTLPKSWPTVPVHMILMQTPDHRGKVLLFQGFGQQESYLWDPVTDAVTNVGVVPGNDVFCAGHSALKDGRSLVIGGALIFAGGNNSTRIFDIGPPDTWTTKPNMHFQRFYPTATTLGDGGRVLSVEGTANGGHATTPEVYDMALDCWRKLTPTPVVTLETYPFMFLLPDGKFFMAGRSVVFGGASTPESRLLTVTIPDEMSCTTDGTAAWGPAVPSMIDGNHGSAALYRAGEHAPPGQDPAVAAKVLKAGGIAPGGGATTAIAERIDASKSPLAWTQVASMNAARTDLDLLTLPTGKVLAIGGTSGGANSGFAGAQMGVEVWDPNAAPQPQGTWTKWACMSEPRLYHSSALLLPDGSVLVAGGGSLVDGFNNFTTYPSYEIFKPPYMFASRPMIEPTSVPSSAMFFSSFDVTLSNINANDIDSVAFIRPGGVTHSFDQDARYVAAKFVVKDASTLTVHTPSSNKVAPAGYYMLFVVANDVPSTAVFVHLEGGGCPP